MSTDSAVVILVSLSLSFLLSGMEAGVFAVSRLRIRHWMRTGNQSARILNRYLENSENFLWTICVGNTVTNFVAVGLFTWWLLGHFQGRPVLFGLAWTAMAFGLYAWCELLPKTLFRRYPNRLSLWMVRPYRIIHWLLSPCVAVVSWMASALLRQTGGKKFTGRLFGNRDELRLVLRESEGAVTEAERHMINRVLDLHHKTLGAVMAPLQKVCSLDAKATIAEALALCRDRGFSRIPVCSREAQGSKVIGVFSLRDALYREGLDHSLEVTQAMRPAFHLREDLKLEIALQKLQRSGHRMAIVVDDAGSDIGIISLQDVLNVIFSEVNA